MSQTRRHRKRRASEAHDLPQAAAAVAPEAAAQPTAAPGKSFEMPNWNWRTFPVYFAFATGGFVGMYTGVVGTANDGQYFFIVAVVWAVLLGFGFSRFSTRWILSRQWAKRRNAKGRK